MDLPRPYTRVKVSIRPCTWWWIAGAVALGAACLGIGVRSSSRSRPRQIDDLLSRCDDVTASLLERVRERRQISS